MVVVVVLPPMSHVMSVAGCRGWVVVKVGVVTASAAAVLVAVVVVVVLLSWFWSGSRGGGCVEMT